MIGFRSTLIAVALVLAQTQAGARIASIQVKGNRRYTVPDVVRLSGLQIGQTASADDLTTAANRLAGTGLFNTVKYSYSTGPGQMTVTFDVEEAVWTLPVIFDNFVWFTDAELTAALGERVPSFDGTAPINHGAGDFIARELQTLLEARHAPGRVTYVAQADLRAGESAPTGAPKYLFKVTDPAPKVCVVHAAGAFAIPESDLVAPLSGMMTGDYSQYFVMSASVGTLIDMYRQKGYWRAAFAAPSMKLDECDGVAVTLNVTEGSPFVWDGADWTGNTALAADALNKILAMKPGDVADQSKIQAGMGDLRRAYGHVGYLNAGMDYVPRLDDKTHRVVFAFTVEEGPQYRMGTLAFPNLRESDAAAIAAKWRLKPGEVYDESYEVEFAMKELDSLETASGARARLEREIDKDAHIVHLRVVFR